MISRIDHYYNSCRHLWPLFNFRRLLPLTSITHMFLRDIQYRASIKSSKLARWEENFPQRFHFFHTTNIFNNQYKFNKFQPFLTFFLSLIDPFPRTMILHPVSCSNCFAVMPRGPRILPTKLNCNYMEKSVKYLLSIFVQSMH